MQDAFAYCAELVRDGRSRSLSRRAVRAGCSSARRCLRSTLSMSRLARVREAAREPLPGEIRLQWWRDVLGGERTGEAGANPVAAALLDVDRAVSAAGGHAARSDRRPPLRSLRRADGADCRSRGLCQEDIFGGGCACGANSGRRRRPGRGPRRTGLRHDRPRSAPFPFTPRGISFTCRRTPRTPRRSGRRCLSPANRPLG